MARPFKPYGTPPVFDFDEYKDAFSLWFHQWETFLALSTINTALPVAERAEYKKNVLFSCLSKPTLHAVLTMGLSAADLQSHTAIIDALRDRCNAGLNPHVWRLHLVRRLQLENESADDWLSDLRDIASKCNFATGCGALCEPKHILSQIIAGVYDEDVRRLLLKAGPQLTLDVAVTTVRTAEAAIQQSANLKSGGAAGIQGLGKKSTYKQNKDSGQPPQPKGQTGGHPDTKSTQRSPSGPGCWWCGSDKRHRQTECPAYGQECRNCGKSGHFQRVCQSEKKPAVAGSLHVDRSSPTTIASVLSSELVPLDFLPDGSTSFAVSLMVLPDTGAEIDAIPASVFRQHFPHISLSSAGSRTVTATGSHIVSLGTFRASLSWPILQRCHPPMSSTVHVLCGLKPPVLSKSSQIALGILHADYPHRHFALVAVEQRVHFPSPVLDPPPSDTIRDADLKSLIAAFPAIFDGICRPMTGPVFHFKLKDGATPFSLRGSRPVAVSLLPLLRDELDQLETQGIIRKVVEPTEWVHPIVLVPKKDGGIRLCVDFRNLNKSIIRPLFDATTPFQAVRTIPTGMKYFTVIDALKGYHQVSLDEESTALTTFSTPFGRYQYLRLPFGVSHAEGDYGRRVYEVFDDLPACRRVVEDVVVFSKTYAEHVQLVRQLFKRAADHNVSINVSKLVFAQSSVNFGGYLIDSSGFRPHPNLTRAIRDFPVPTNITDVRSFCGLCQQVGNFSTLLASTLLPLSPLLKKGFAWEWTSSHNDVFNKARLALSDVSELAFYDPGLPTALHVDASRLNDSLVLSCARGNLPRFGALFRRDFVFYLMLRSATP